jgi:hypothetical protein
MELAPSAPFETSSTKLVSLGTRYRDAHNRVFRYALAGGSTLARGKINVAASITANHTNMSFASAPAVNSTSVTVTLGGTAATEDQYQDGWLVVQDGGGEGRAYPIEGHGAQATTTGNLEVFLKEKLDTLGVISEANVDLIKNRYDSVVVSVADQLDPPVGVNIVSITTLYYGWVQTWGPCSVLMDENVGVGAEIVIGESVVGAVQTSDGVAEPRLGYMGPQGGVDTEYQLVYLQIEP